MIYLLDTCVISELIRPKPDKSVVQWIKKQHESSLHISVMTIGELKKGISKLEISKRRNSLDSWFENEFMSRFANRVFAIDAGTALTWATLVAASERKGTPLPTIDGLIAASAVFHEATLVTRNIKDFSSKELNLLNPWD